MILIGDILVSDELINQQFVCDLSKCKGACCVEGDFGAPLDKAEQAAMPEYFKKVEHMLSKDSLKVIEAEGYTRPYEEAKMIGTPLLADGSCVYLAEDALGIKRCSFEIAHEQGQLDFKKPVSCHLYPVRVEENEMTGFKAVNYDVWSICKAACTLGKSLKVPLYQFVREALVRKFGFEFYQALDGAFLDKHKTDKD